MEDIQILKISSFIPIGRDLPAVHELRVGKKGSAQKRGLNDIQLNPSRCENSILYSNLSRLTNSAWARSQQGGAGAI